MHKRTIPFVLLSLLLGVVISFLQCSKKYPLKSKRVILLGIDALSTDGLQVANTPNLDRLIANGALSLKTRGVMPTVSAPNWGSILLGAGPEQHGITKNGWKTNFHTIEPTVADSLGFFPSIFEVLKKGNPSLRIAAFFDWKGLGDLFNHRYLDTLVVTKDFKDTYQQAIPYILKYQPDFTFIYVGHVDEVGHQAGHGSPEYYQAIHEVDAQIGRLLSALQKAGLYRETHFIVVSDHGGVGHGHGGESMAEIQIPWLISGPGILQNKMLEQPINVFDTAPTIAFLFNVPLPECWIGRPVLGAFEQLPAAQKNTRLYVPKPVPSVKSGLYTKAQTLTFSNITQGGEVRFTTNGQLPKPTSPLFAGPLKLDRSMVVKAATFKQGSRSEVVTIDFRLLQNIKQVTLKYLPSPKYPAKGALSLVDGQLANTDYGHPAWLGFEEKDLICTLDLGTIKKVKAITLRFLEQNDAWIFLPQAIVLKTGIKKGQWQHKLQKTKSEIANSPGAVIHAIRFELNAQPVRFIQIFAQNIGHCPPEHPGAGGKAWLFIDEILIE